MHILSLMDWDRNGSISHLDVGWLRWSLEGALHLVRPIPVLKLLKDFHVDGTLEIGGRRSSELLVLIVIGRHKLLILLSQFLIRETTFVEGYGTTFFFLYVGWGWIPRNELRDPHWQAVVDVTNEFSEWMHGVRVYLMNS
jgi:hypothetical protein